MRATDTCSSQTLAIRLGQQCTHARATIHSQDRWQRQGPRLIGRRSCRLASHLPRGPRPRCMLSSSSSSNSSTGTCPGTRALTSSPARGRQSQGPPVRCVPACLFIMSLIILAARARGLSSGGALSARSSFDMLAGCAHFTRVAGYGRPSVQSNVLCTLSHDAGHH